MEQEFKDNLMMCTTTQEVKDLIKENKQLLKDHQELYNNVFRARLRINRINKAKFENWGELCN